VGKYTINFVTTCKGRLHHIKETLPLLSGQAEKEIILVDYSCPQNTAKWVGENYKYVNLVKVESNGFNASHARNQGAEKVDSDFICFIDADVKIKPGFINWLHENISPHCFYSPSNNPIKNYELWGTVILPTQAYKLVKGYDENFSGWGGEDDDLYYRLKTIGFSPFGIPPHFLEAIKHEDTERVLFHEIKDRSHQFYINRFYTTAKKQVMAFYRAEGELPADIRKKLYGAVSEAFKKNSKNPEINIAINLNEGLSNKHQLSKSLSLKLKLSDIKKS
jgi:glycosyltransferase involved in cell wall biosynthesis